jgi:competence protein ComEA
MDAKLIHPSAPTPASAGHGGGHSAPAAPSGARSAWVKKLRDSVWAPVAVKAGGIFAGMLALSAIGAASTLAGSSVAVSAAAPSSASAGGAWLPPDHDEHAAATPPGAAPSAKTPGAATPGAAPAEPVVTPATSAAPPGPPDGEGRTADGKIVLNRATADDLMKLPRVGAKRAQAILELRQKLGHFRQLTDLLRVRGIGRKTLKPMLPLLVLDAPAHAP